MDDCIFCKIVKGEIPSSKVWENSDFLAIMDINPVVKGHILLLPKVHSKWMHETDDVVISKIFVVAKLLINKMRIGLPCDYVQLSVVGEEVPHFHIHLLPRTFSDGLLKSKTTRYESQVEIDNYAKKIKE